MNTYWLEQAEADVPAEEDWLGPDEIRLLSGMRFAKRRADWRLGRWTAKQAVAAYLHLPGGPSDLAAIEVLPAPSGAPLAWFKNEMAPLMISISHSAGRAICAVAPSGAGLGCDLELIEARSECFVSDYFATDEQATISRVSPNERNQLVTLLWSAKESALKMLGVGLRVDTRSVEVNLVEESQPVRENCAPCTVEGSDRACCRNQWRPLQVRYADGQIFDGWWQRSGYFLRTLVAAPVPARPIFIHLSETASSRNPIPAHSSVGRRRDMASEAFRPACCLNYPRKKPRPS